MSVTLNVRAAGESGPVLILLHGLFGSSANWGGIARKLSEQYRVLVPDLRNHGQSPHHDDVSYAAMVGDLLGLLDSLQLESAALVGHSMGGKLAMQMALSHPERVQGIAVVDMAPVAYRHNFNVIFRGFAAVDLASLNNRREADEQMSRHVLDPQVRAFLLQNLHRTDQGWVWRANLPALEAHQQEITGFSPPHAAYRNPTHFIHGGSSDYLLPEYEPEVFRLFPRAQICKVEGAGHWVYAEQPQGFARCLDAFLKRVK